MRSVLRAVSFAAAIILTLMGPGWSQAAGLGRWRTGAPLPEGLSHPGVTSMGGKVYAVGGFLTPVHRDAQDVAFVYDPQLDRWTALPKLSSPRGSIVAAAVDGKLHMLARQRHRA